MFKFLTVFPAILLVGNVFAEKTQTTELKWGSEDEHGCRGSICLRADQHSWPDMNEKTDKSDRMRRIDPFSVYNSDDSNDKKSAGFMIKVD